MSDASRDPAAGSGAAGLVQAARRALAHAYAPYSGYAVGAALEAESGRVHTGVNVENAAYGSTICAERAALVKAVSEGERAFRRIAIVSDGGAVPSPCGACRQVLAEFSPDLEVLVEEPGGIRARSLRELLPHAFTLPPRGSRPARGSE